MPKNIYELAYELRMELYHKIFTVVTIIISFFLFISLFLSFIIFPVSVKSSSMEPELSANTAVFVSPLAKRPDRGDVVLLKPLSPKANSLFHRGLDQIVGFFTARRVFPFAGSDAVSENSCVRRVLAVPGDTIYMQNYILYIKRPGDSQYQTEYELREKDYEAHIETAPASWDTELGVIGSFADKDSPLVLGKDEYFVLCDNRNNGADSRMWGTINASMIQGRVLFSYFPLRKIRGY